MIIYKNLSRIDLTIVEQIENGVTSINYEVEVEFLNMKNEVSNKYRSHSGFLLMRDMINICEKIEEDSCDTKHHNNNDNLQPKILYRSEFPIK